ncbi:Nudix hydrolase 8 [Glycine soja]|uniref:Nudix hydrolase 8 n=1 Tax=Glycine soja TaxID=3848 RepID=A0A445M5Y4_GLYSO|nr:Nudix hydrolase 8 [Glycine soja]
MELKSFSFNSEMVLVGRTRTCPALLSNSSSVRFCSQLNCFGDNLAAETSFHHINGTNGSISSLCSRNLRVLDASDDVYEGVVIDSDRLPDNPSTFATNLRFSLHHWKKGKKGIWLRLPSEQSDFVPITIKRQRMLNSLFRGQGTS